MPMWLGGGARVNYRSQRVFVLFLLTHAEYERGFWKS